MEIAGLAEQNIPDGHLMPSGPVLSPKLEKAEMYVKAEASSVCKIASDIPPYMEYLRSKYPGEFAIDMAVNHKGEHAPSYRLKGIKDANANPVWINGIYLEFLRYTWDRPAIKLS